MHRAPASQTTEKPAGTGRLAHVLAFLAACVALLAISAGALVTSIRAGDAEPGWNPLNVFGWLSRVAQGAPGGLWYELLHRVVGFTLGCLVLALAVVLWRREPRRGVRKLGYAALLVVCLQALLGGLRVKFLSDERLQDFALALFGTGENIHPIRIGIMLLHAFGAQLLFCLLVALTLVLSSGWREGHHPGERSPCSRRTRQLCVVTTAALFVQLLLGAFVRHAEGDGVLYHAIFALVVTLLVLVLAPLSRRSHPGVFPIWHLIGLARFLILFQLALGIASWVIMLPGWEYRPPWDVTMLIRTGHVANGAMILALLVTATCRAYKLLHHEDGSAEPSIQPHVRGEGAGA
ncbi:MAG: heme A synthase [Planctomycetota bacterium]